MNELITKAPDEIVTDNFCRHCGGPLAARDNFCGECGTGCHDLFEIVDTKSANAIGHLVAEPSSILVTTDGMQTIRAVLDNRLAVIGIIAFIGPLGLLGLWFSPRFAKRTKIITTVAYALLTVVLPLTIAWYWLDYSIRPLLDAFAK